MRIVMMCLGTPPFMIFSLTYKSLARPVYIFLLALLTKLDIATKIGYLTVVGTPPLFPLVFSSMDVL